MAEVAMASSSGPSGEMVDYDGDNEMEDGQLASTIRKTDGMQLNVSNRRQ